MDILANMYLYLVITPPITGMVFIGLLFLFGSALIVLVASFTLLENLRSISYQLFLHLPLFVGLITARFVDKRIFVALLAVSILWAMHLFPGDSRCSCPLHRIKSFLSHSKCTRRAGPGMAVR